MSKNRKKARKSGKSLLSERTVRRWQSLAAINEMGSYGEAYDGEEREEEVSMDDMPNFDEEGDSGFDEEPDFSMGEEPDAEPSSSADELEISNEELEGAEPLLRKLADLATASMGNDDADDFADELADPIGDEDEGLDDMEMGDDSDMEEDEEDEELAENLSRLERLDIKVVDQNKIVKEVMKRVTKRLLNRLK